MAVAGVDVGSDRVEVEIDLAGRVGTVDDREDACRARPPADLRDVVDTSARPFDVRAEDDAGSRSRFELGQRTAHERGPGPLGHVAPEQLHSTVLGVAEQHLIPGAKLERAGDRVHGRARVRREGEAARARPDMLSEARAGRLQQLREPPFEGEELHRLPLQLALKPLIGLEHGCRAGTERAVVQEHHARIEEELLLQHS